MPSTIFWLRSASAWNRGLMRFDDAFGRFAPQEGIHDGIERNSTPGNVISAVLLLRTCSSRLAKMFRPDLRPAHAGSLAFTNGDDAVDGEILLDLLHLPLARQA